MKHFKTPKGTELPLMNLKGKDYLQVAHRLVWFREEKPLWSIETTILEGLAFATIKDETGRVIATAHKSIGSKQYAVESAETGAIGRALAIVGYGTAHCGDELEEGEEIADAPIDRVHHEPAAPEAVPGPLRTPTDGITEKQQKRLFAISKECGWSKEDLRNYINKLGLEHTKDLNWMQYESMVKNIQNFPKLDS